MLTCVIVMASSRVGKATISMLLKKCAGNFRIRAVFRTEEKAKSFQEEHCIDDLEIVIGLDPKDPSTHEKAFQKADKAFIIAPQLENRDEIVNLLLDGVKTHGIRHVVLIGGVFQEEQKFLFHKQWMSSRKHAESLGLFWTQLECSDFMENAYRHVNSIKKENKMYGSGINGISAPVTISDVALAAANILSSEDDSHHNRAYRVIGGENLSPLDLANLFSNALGRSISFIDIGIQEARRVALESNQMPPWQCHGFYDWMELYYITGKLKEVKSDLPLLGINPCSFEKWLNIRKDDFM